MCRPEPLIVTLSALGRRLNVPVDGSVLVESDVARVLALFERLAATRVFAAPDEAYARQRVAFGPLISANQDARPGPWITVSMVTPQ